MNWNHFTDDQSERITVIPHGTIAKVTMRIKLGEYNDLERNWTGGYATRNESTGSVYLKVQYTVLDGEYAKRTIWSMIGLHSEKGEAWGRMGSDFIRDIVNSAYGLDPANKSAEAQQRRMVESFSELDGISFLARIEVERDETGNDKNVIKKAITPDNSFYRAHMGGEDMVVGSAIWGGRN